MKMFKIYLVVLLTTVAVLSACKQDEETVASKEELLTGNGSKSWKITGAEGRLLEDEYSTFRIDFYNNNKIYTGDQEIPSEWLPEELQDLPTFPDCAKDNIIVFKNDNTYQANEGATSCNTASEFLLTSGTWSLSDDEKTLILNDNSGVEIKYDLTGLTAQTITGDTSGSFVIDGTAVDYTLTTTFTAQ